VGAEAGECAVGGGGHRRPQRDFVPGVERLASGSVAAGGDLAGLLEPAVEHADPLGRDGVLAGDGGERVSGLAIGQHTPPEVQRNGGHGEAPKGDEITRASPNTASSARIKSKLL
jgi:hypothetical protein